MACATDQVKWEVKSTAQRSPAARAGRIQLVSASLPAQARNPVFTAADLGGLANAISIRCGVLDRPLSSGDDGAGGRWQ
jgi:hypothetical protein